MKSCNRWKTAIAACAALPLLAAPALAAGGGKSLGKASGVVPATLKPIPGTNIKEVTFTPRAVERIDVHTARVEERSVNGSSRKAVPYSAIIYTPDGATWVYAVPRERTYLRTAIDVYRIVGDHVFLKEGPPVGTQIATIGVAEIYGAEFEVGH